MSGIDFEARGKSREEPDSLFRSGSIRIDLSTKLSVKHPIALEFKNLGFKIQVAQTTSSWKPSFFRELQTTEKVVLQGINGSVVPGEVLVVMGPSGSGKTTLLNILAGRAQGTRTGSIKINGADEEVFKYRRQIAYVTQDDCLISRLSVKQNLTTTAKLRLKDQEQYRRDEVIDELGLTGCQNTAVGGYVTLWDDQKRGVSGGERKRTAIADALMTNPSLLLLDEPTSGLDSFYAKALILQLKQLAAKGRTVILTIHQPSSPIFDLFDKFLLLAEGRMIYFGQAKQAVNYFAELGYSCPRTWNPPDYFIELVAHKTGPLPDGQVVENGSVLPRLITAAENIVVPDPQVNLAPISESQEPKFVRSWPEQVVILFRRHWLLTLGGTDLFPIIQTLIFSILVGLIWWRLAFNDDTIQQKNGAIFNLLVFGVVFPPLYSSMGTFLGERWSLLKERASGSYHLSAYFVAKRCAEIPFEMILPLICTIFSYWFINLRENAHFLLFLTIMFITSFTFSAIGICIATLLPKVKTALTATTILVMFCMMTSGFYIAINKLPGWLKWSVWLSPLLYAYEALVYNEYSGRQIPLVAGATFFSPATLESFGNITAVSSHHVFEQLGFRMSLAISVGGLLGWCGFTNLLAYVLIHFLV